MTVFVDTERLRDPYSGLGQFCRQLGEELVRQKPPGADLTFLVPAGQEGVFGPEATYRPATFWQKLRRPVGFEVWHCTHQDSAFLPARPTKLILTIHDLNFLERSDYTDAKKDRKLALLQRKIDRAAALTTISEYTASVVRQHLTVPDIPLTVIYNGNALAQPAAHSSAFPANQRIPQSPFFLFLGVIHPKKNLHTLLPLLEAFPDWHLVLAGPDAHPYATHLRQQARQLGVGERLVMPGAVDDATKQQLYRQCGGFLFPSLSEGFGLPVVEAMSAGKPVFLSRLTSLPEVGGRDAYYFDSFEPEDMAQTIFDGLQDFAANPFRAARLRQHAAQFSWSRAARQYWELYRNMN